MNSLEDVRPRPTYWMCPACGAGVIVDESRLTDWVRCEMRCDCGVGIEMVQISARVYALVYDALLAGAALGGRRR